MLQVAFKLFGCIPGHVGLRGRVEAVGEGRDTVKVRGAPGAAARRARRHAHAASQCWARAGLGPDPCSPCGTSAPCPGASGPGTVCQRAQRRPAGKRASVGSKPQARRSRSAVSHRAGVSMGRWGPRQVRFERPELVLPGLALRIGPPSAVQLATTYLDERVRLGRGSRGSRFVFVRGGSADGAGARPIARAGWHARLRRGCAAHPGV
jgi:hypothetical protein